MGMMLFNLGDLLTALIAGAAFGSGITLLALWGLESHVKQQGDL